VNYIEERYIINFLEESKKCTLGMLTKNETIERVNILGNRKDVQNIKIYRILPSGKKEDATEEFLK
jgi:hypothetical protein